MTITVKLLEDFGIHQTQIDAFQKAFGLDFSITVEKAVQNSMDINWFTFAGKLLQKEYLQEYDEKNRIWWDLFKKYTEIYSKNISNAEKKYFEMYGNDTNKDWKHRADYMKPHLTEYEKSIDTHIKDYAEKCARLFAELYIKQTKESLS